MAAATRGGAKPSSTAAAKAAVAFSALWRPGTSTVIWARISPKGPWSASAIHNRTAGPHPPDLPAGASAGSARCENKSLLYRCGHSRDHRVGCLQDRLHASIILLQLQHRGRGIGCWESRGCCEPLRPGMNRCSAHHPPRPSARAPRDTAAEGSRPARRWCPDTHPPAPHQTAGSLRRPAPVPASDGTSRAAGRRNRGCSAPASGQRRPGKAASTHRRIHGTMGSGREASHRLVPAFTHRL